MTKEREALKLALEALEEINKLSVGENAICLPAEIDTAMDACREALAQPEQEPVAWFSTLPDGRLSIKIVGKPTEGNWEPLYTTPPQRKPLTDEEIRKAKHHIVDGAYHYSFQQGVRWAEHKHGIKE